MKHITFQNVIDADKMQKQGKNQMEVQLFLLSRFHGIPKKEIQSMPFYNVQPLIDELEEYMKEKPIQKIEKFSAKEADTRFDLLDL
jgi:hypothetical protein